MKKLTVLGMSLLLSLTTLQASAQPKVEDAIEYRQAIFQAFKWNFGKMAAMVQGRADYNTEEFIKRATNLEQLSTQPWEAFIPGSFDTEESGTLVKAETDAAGYQAKINDFEQAAIKLAEAAKTNDLKTIRPAFAAAAKTCKSCHDQFRK